MGWWKVEGTDDVLGDDPLEALEAAVAAIVSHYEQAFGRKPTKAEWEALLHAVLGSATSEERVTDEGMIEKVHVELR